MKKVTLTKEISPYQMEWRNHPSINAWTRQNGIIGKRDMVKWFDKLDYDSSIEMFGVISEIEYFIPDYQCSNKNIGTCGLTSINHIHGSAEFSLLISPEYQGKGYGTAALAELLKYGFKNLRLNCIWGETFTNNPALKMFLKLGMVEEGRLRQRYYKNGEYTDSIMISITEKEAREKAWFNS